MFFAEKAHAHGYVSTPKSRTFLCNLGKNNKCGAVTVEPQSVEGVKRFPFSGPPDGKIASGGGKFPELDQQSFQRWTKVSIKPGPNQFKWTITAGHATENYRYFITKEHWNPDKPLTREQFGSQFFAIARTSNEMLNVPNRTGYHVILAVWNIGDGNNAFYQAIDVDFGGKNQVDDLPPTRPRDLKATNIQSTSALLAWKASTDNYGVVGYHIYQKGKFFDTVDHSTLIFKARGLTADTSFTFSVRAFDSVGNLSPESNKIILKTYPASKDSEPPKAPTQLKLLGEPSFSSLYLNWKRSSSKAPIRYQIYQNGVLIDTRYDTETYKVTGLTEKTRYTFYIKAVNQEGQMSKESNELTLTTPKAAPAWRVNYAYKVKEEATYNNEVYICIVAHTSLPGWTPDSAGTLWRLKI